MGGSSNNASNYWGLTGANYPGAPTLQTDPTQIATPGISQEMQQVKTNAGAQAGAANNGAMAALQRAGVAGGSEAGNALGNIAGQSAAGVAQGEAGLQNQQFQEQESLMNSLNQAKTNLYGTTEQGQLGQNAQGNQALQGIGQIAALAAMFA